MTCIFCRHSILIILFLHSLVQLLILTFLFDVDKKVSLIKSFITLLFSLLLVPSVYFYIIMVLRYLFHFSPILGSLLHFMKKLLKIKGMAGILFVYSIL